MGARIALVLAAYLKDLVARRDAEQQAAPDRPNGGPNETATVGRRAIEAALEKRRDFSIRQMPLREAIENMLKPAEIPYYVNWRSLADGLGLRGGEPVEFSAKGITVRDAVNELLSSRDMAWLVRDEVLYITGPFDFETVRNGEAIVYRRRISAQLTGYLTKETKSCESTTLQPYLSF